MIKFLKVRDVKSPSRSNKFDAGIDFYVPVLTKEFLEILKEKNPTIYRDDIRDSEILLRPHKRILIPSGIYCQMSKPGRALIATNKSGVATKLGLVVGATTVDYLYQGEIHLSLINTSDEVVKLTSDMKIIQFIETPIYDSDIEINENIPIEDFYGNVKTSRGNKGFGSTDKI